MHRRIGGLQSRPKRFRLVQIEIYSVTRKTVGSSDIALFSLPHIGRRDIRDGYRRSAYRIFLVDKRRVTPSPLGNPISLVRRARFYCPLVFDPSIVVICFSEPPSHFRRLFLRTSPRRFSLRNRSLRFPDISPSVRQHCPVPFDSDTFWIPFKREFIVGPRNTVRPYPTTHDRKLVSRPAIPDDRIERITHRRNVRRIEKNILNHSVRTVSFQSSEISLIFFFAPIREPMSSHRFTGV